MYPILLILIFLLFTFCDPPTGENYIQDYPPQFLTEADLSLVNYNEKDSIPFVHSSGLEFYLTVDTIFTERSTESRTSPSMPREEVESQYTYLSSDYPYLKIKIRLVPALSELHSSTICINSKTSYCFNNNGSFPETTHDTVTVTLGTKTYYDVYSYPAPSSWDNSDNTIRIKSLLYSPKDGILQIGKSNGETFTINE